MRTWLPLLCVALAASCSPSPEPLAATTTTSVPSSFCADVYCETVNCQAGAGGSDDLFGRWSAHKFFLELRADLTAFSSLGIEYTDDGGELREDTTFALELSEDGSTLTATVASLSDAVSYADERPPRDVPPGPDGLAVGDAVAFRLCRPHLLEAEDVRTSGTYGFGFRYLCQAGVEQSVCGA